MTTRANIACLAGNALEWFDYLLYVYLTPIFAPLFFPTSDPNTAILFSFMAFSLSFFVRPLAGIMLGILGDRYGRRCVLLFTVSLMTLSTLSMGLLPDYRHVGLFAPILLVMIRLIQGVAVSGELNSSTNYLYEQTSSKQRFLVSCVSLTANFGIFCGALTTFLLHQTFTMTELQEGVWRMPFLFASVLGALLFIFRLNLVNQETSDTTQPAKLVQVWRDHHKAFYSVVLLCCPIAIGNYFLFGFFNVYIEQYGQVSKLDAALVNLICLGASMPLLILYGVVSELFGSVRIYLFGLLSITLLSPLVFYLLQSQQFSLVLCGEMLFAFALSAMAASMPYLMAIAFPASIRNTATTFAYNLSFSLFGGTAPVIALSSILWFQQTIAPGIYLSLISLSVFTIYIGSIKICKQSMVY